MARIINYRVQAKLKRDGKTIKVELDESTKSPMPGARDLDSVDSQLITKISAELSQKNQKAMTMAESSLMDHETEGDVTLILSYLED